jgi:hypothetical protein
VAESSFGYAIEVTRDGVVVGAVPASLAVCLEDALFGAVISGRIPNDGSVPPYTLTPKWESENPRSVATLELRFGDAPAVQYDARVVAPQARAGIAALLQAGVLEKQDQVEWRLTAEKRESVRRFATRVSRAPLPLRETSLPDTNAGELALEFDEAVLKRLSESVADAAAIEGAWLLVASLYHDPERGAAALRVREAVDVAVGRGGASQHHFAFEPAAFVAARRAAAQFGDLIPGGWAHSHPPCQACRAKDACPVDTRFFSADDVEVHSAAFTSPYMVGLVIGKVSTQSAARPGFRLYGWHRAEVVERTYRLRE